MAQNTMARERVLTHNEDWDDWLEQTKEYMDSIGLWKYMNPYSKDVPDEPQQPDWPTAEEVELAQNADDKTHWKMDTRIAYLGHRTGFYNDFNHNREKAIQYLQRTVGSRGRLILMRIKTNFGEIRTLHAKMSDLEKEFAPSELERLSSLFSRMKRLEEEASNFRNHEAWMLKWIRINDKFVRQDIPHGERIVLRNFVAALRIREPDIGLALQLCTEPEESCLDLEVAIGIYRDSMRRNNDTGVIMDTIQAHRAEEPLSSRASPTLRRERIFGNVSIPSNTTNEHIRQTPRPLVSLSYRLPNRQKFRSPAFSSSSSSPGSILVGCSRLKEEATSSSSFLSVPGSRLMEEAGLLVSSSSLSPTLLLAGLLRLEGCSTVTGKPVETQCRSIHDCNVINPLKRPKPEDQTIEWKKQFTSFQQYCRTHLDFAKMAALEYNDFEARKILEESM